MLRHFNLYSNVHFQILHATSLEFTLKTLDILIVLGAIAVAVVYLVQRARAKKEEPPKNCGSSCSGKDNCSSGGCH